MVCRFRPDGTILFVNNAYALALGTTPERLTGGSFWEFVAPGDRQRVRDMLDALTPHHPLARIENRLRTGEGERWTLWTNRALEFDAAGRVVEAQSSGIDITERKRFEEALATADRRKDEFLATLSHELRNPLAPLRNALFLLRRADGGRAAGDPLYEMMERQMNHLVRLVDDLLEMSRVSRGAFELRKERVEVATIVRNAVETSESLIKRARHRLEIALPEAPLFLDGDPVRLAQILSNLLNNAAKYTDDGGQIFLSARGDGATVLITVRDTGVGMEPELLGRVFEMFSRGDRRAVRGESSLGIGLALARRLAEMHGGTIEAHSAGLGKGSEFSVRLPLARQPAADSKPVIRARPPLPHRRILVVDDNRDAADSLGMLLAVLGAEVRIARDGAEALREFSAYEPSIVLLDIGMPGMDGYEVARRIRSGFPERRAAIVALTGWGQEADRLRAREAGFDHHLVKPADVETLQGLLATL